ncbi:MAG: SMC-Scp complex subunit ScpB [Candidatus Micrarchaeota archaeon]|nr:SMC-Scp complex subunit ScpB [Candidatus Micrarchaeota archaeon]
MKERVVEALLFLKPEGLAIEDIKALGIEDVEGLMNALNDQYKELSFYVKKEGNRLVMTIKPSLVPEVRKYFHQRDLTKAQLKLLALVKAEKRILKSEASKKLKSHELEDLINRGFLKMEKQGKRTYLVIGPYYKDYFGDV